MSQKVFWTGVTLTIALTGCVSTSSVLEVGRDTYSVSSTADGMASASSAREKAYLAGKEKCNKDGKQFQMIHEKSERTRMDIDTTITVTFRCLDQQDREYQRPEIRTAPNTVIEDRRK